MRHGPTLFPIIGRLVDDEYRLNGRTYKLGIHGFAPHKEFRWTERTATHCTLELTDDEETRAVYPFPFALSVTHAVEATALTVTYTLTDTGDATLPASIGTHPGFNWPLLPGASKDGHCIVFSNDPGTPVFRGTDGLISARAHRRPSYRSEPAPRGSRPSTPAPSSSTARHPCATKLPLDMPSRSRPSVSPNSASGCAHPVISSVSNAGTATPARPPSRVSSSTNLASCTSAQAKPVR